MIRITYGALVVETDDRQAALLLAEVLGAALQGQGTAKPKAVALAPRMGQCLDCGQPSGKKKRCPTHTRSHELAYLRDYMRQRRAENKRVANVVATLPKQHVVTSTDSSARRVAATGRSALRELEAL